MPLTQHPTAASTTVCMPRGRLQTRETPAACGLSAFTALHHYVHLRLAPLAMYLSLPDPNPVTHPCTWCPVQLGLWWQHAPPCPHPQVNAFSYPSQSTKSRRGHCCFKCKGNCARPQGLWRIRKILCHQSTPPVTGPKEMEIQELPDRIQNNCSQDAQRATRKHRKEKFSMKKTTREQIGKFKKI